MIAPYLLFISCFLYALLYFCPNIKDYKRYSMNTVVSEWEGKGFYLAQVKNSDLSCFSYYLESEKQALIIDPVFDTKIYQDILSKRGAALKNVVLTHYHADFISGHLEFKVPLLMGPSSITKLNHYEVTSLKDGQLYWLGKTKLIILHTPGHTPEGTTYILTDSDGKDVCLFTGDTLFLGDVGRPDLSHEQELTMVDLAGMLYDSLQKIKKLPDQLRIYPAHESGSACAGKKIEEGNFSTIEQQKQKNYALKIQGRNQFISTIIEDIQKPPQYYFHDSRINKIGPSQHEVQFKKANNRLDVKQFQHLARTCKIFDTRSSIDDGGLIKYSYWIHNKAPITSWIPMLATPHDQILVVVEQGKGEEIIERFIRLGFFNVKGYNNFKVSEYKGEKIFLKVVTGKQALDIKQRKHLDIRNRDEWKKTGVIEGAVTIPLKQLKDRCFEVKGLKNLVVNCKTGMRARLAMSILATAGIQSIALAEKVEELEKIGFNMLPYVENKNLE